MPARALVVVISKDKSLAFLVFALSQRKRKHRMRVRDVFKFRKNWFKSYLWATENYFSDMQITPNQVEHLLTLVAPQTLAFISTYFRDTGSPQSRFYLILRQQLIAKELHIVLSLQYQIVHQTISEIISETCNAFYDVLASKYVRTTKKFQDLLVILKQFEDTWC